MSFLECFSLCFVKGPRQQEYVEEAHKVVCHVSNESEAIIHHEIGLLEYI
jgi:hypothetical protein